MYQEIAYGGLSERAHRVMGRLKSHGYDETAWPGLQTSISKRKWNACSGAHWSESGRWNPEVIVAHGGFEFDGKLYGSPRDTKASQEPTGTEVVLWPQADKEDERKATDE